MPSSQVPAEVLLYRVLLIAEQDALEEIDYIIYLVKGSWPEVSHYNLSLVFDDPKRVSVYHWVLAVDDRSALRRRVKTMAGLTAMASIIHVTFTRMVPQEGEPGWPEALPRFERPELV